LRTRAASVLLIAGATATVSYRGATAFQWARNGGHSECAELLRGLATGGDLPLQHDPYTDVPVRLPAGTPRPPGAGGPMAPAQMWTLRRCLRRSNVAKSGTTRARNLHSRVSCTASRAGPCSLTTMIRWQNTTAMGPTFLSEGILSVDGSGESDYVRRWPATAC